MSFILSAQRDENVVRAFERYRTYLQSVRHILPDSVFTLASSDWYFWPSDHRCPHDGGLESVTISEPSSGERHELRFDEFRLSASGHVIHEIEWCGARDTTRWLIESSNI